MEMTRQQFIENFISNLEKERVSLGLTQHEMASKLGMSVSGYKKMVLGKTSRIDLALAQPLYQLTGKFVFELCGDTSPDLIAYSKFRALSPYQKNFIADLIDFETSFTENYTASFKEEKPENYLSVLVPTSNVEDGMLWDSVNITKVNAAPYRQLFGADLHCGILITSNHLHPVYHTGDILLISRRAPRDGDVAIFVNKEEGRAYLRKFRQTNPCLLEPINDYGLTFEVDPYNEQDMDKWIKFGCVLTKMRV